MRLLLYNYKCAKCGNVFQDADLSGEHYGEFLMRSKNNDVVYLYAIDEKVFQEVSKLFSKVQGSKKMGTRYFHMVFSDACDPDLKGNLYEIGRFPPCPKSGSNIMYSWGPVNSPVLIEKEIKPVTHEAWSKLTEKEKILAIYKAIIFYFFKKPLRDIKEIFYVFTFYIRKRIFFRR